MNKNISQLNTQQAGFTLIELIAVIIVLGILSASAIPKFIHLRTEANIKTLETMGASILSTANIVHAKSVLLGVQNQASANIDLDADNIDDVAIVYGYTSAHRSNGIPKTMKGDFASAWTWSGNGSNNIFYLTTAKLGKRSGLYINNTSVMASNCYLVYYPASSTSAPRINYVTSGC